MSYQHHVFFYDGFMSVHINTQKNSELWRNLITSPIQQLWLYLDEGMDTEFDYEWLKEDEVLSIYIYSKENVFK